jgi:hypothetical protein
MACFIKLRSDYPLILTLFEPAYPRDLTSSCIARFTSPSTILVPLIQLNTRFRSGSTRGSALTSALTSAHPHTLHRQANPLGDGRQHMRCFASSSFMPTSHWCLPSNTNAQICAAALNSIFASRQLLVDQIGGMCGHRSHMLLRGAAFTGGVRRKDRTSPPQALGGMPVRGQSGQVR